MSTAPSPPRRPKQVTRRKRNELPLLLPNVQQQTKALGCRMKDIATSMGMHPPSLSRTLGLRDMRVSTIMALSEAAQHNFFDYYINMLPEHLRDTVETRTLQTQLAAKDAEQEALRAELAAMQKELEAMKRERDTFHDLLKGRLK